MAKSIDEEIAEIERLDSSQEPVEEPSPTEQETVASDEEIAAEDESLELGQAQSPQVDVEPVSETPSTQVDNPELTSFDAPASQVSDPSPPSDEGSDRSPDVSEPPVPGEASVDLVESPSVEQEETAAADVPESDVESPETEQVVSPEVETPETEFDPPTVQQDEISEVPTPSASVEPLSAPSVIDEQAQSETPHDVVDEPAGFQGEVTLPDVPEATHSAFPSTGNDSMSRHEDAVMAQMQQQQRAAENLAKSLATELDPVFEQMRTANENAVRDYMQRQMIETVLIGRIR